METLFPNSANEEEECLGSDICKGRIIDQNIRKISTKTNKN